MFGCTCTCTEGREDFPTMLIPVNFEKDTISFSLSFITRVILDTSFSNLCLSGGTRGEDLSKDTLPIETIQWYMYVLNQEILKYVLTHRENTPHRPHKCFIIIINCYHLTTAVTCQIISHVTLGIS